MALLALYQALRTAIADAVQSVPGTDPDRASYQVAITTAQDLVTTVRNIIDPDGDLAGDIGRAVLAHLNPPRRPASAPAASSSRSAAGASTRPASPPPPSRSPPSAPRSTPPTGIPRLAARDP